MKPDAKSLITGNRPVNEGLGDEAGPRGPVGGPGDPGMRGGRRPGLGGRGPGGPGGPPEPEGMLSRRDRMVMKDLVLLDLLTAMGDNSFYAAIVDMAIKGTDPDPSMIQHFLDEAGKFANKMSPEVVELMNKLAALPK